MCEVMARYLLVEAKFKKDMKVITLEGHQWHLRSSDHNSVGVDFNTESWMLCIEWF